MVTLKAERDESGEATGNWLVEGVSDETVTPQKFTLQCERREGGGLRITSDDVPGLILSGADVRSVLRDVAPAIDCLMRRNSNR